MMGSVFLLMGKRWRILDEAGKIENESSKWFGC